MSQLPVRRIKRDFLFRNTMNHSLPDNTLKCVADSSDNHINNNEKESKTRSPIHYEENNKKLAITKNIDKQHPSESLAVEDTRKVISPKIIVSPKALSKEITSSSLVKESTNIPFKDGQVKHVQLNDIKAAANPSISHVNEYEDDTRQIISKEDIIDNNTQLNSSLEKGENNVEVDADDDAISLFAGSDFEDNMEHTDCISENVKITISSKEEDPRNLKLKQSPKKTTPLVKKLGEVTSSQARKAQPIGRLPNIEAFSLQNEMDNGFISKAIIDACIFPDKILLSDKDVASLIKIKPYFKTRKTFNEHQIGKDSTSYHDKYSTADQFNAKHSNKDVRNNNMSDSRDVLPKRTFIQNNSKISSNSGYQEHSMINPSSEKHRGAYLDPKPYAMRESSSNIKRASNPYAQRYLETVHLRDNAHSSNPPTNFSSPIPPLLQTPVSRQTSSNAFNNLSLNERKRKLEVENTPINKPRRISDDRYSTNYGSESLSSHFPTRPNKNLSNNAENIESFLQGFPKQDTDLRLVYFNPGSNSAPLDINESTKINSESTLRITYIRNDIDMESPKSCLNYSAPDPVVAPQKYYTSDPVVPSKKYSEPVVSPQKYYTSDPVVPSKKYSEPVVSPQKYSTPEPVVSPQKYSTPDPEISPQIYSTSDSETPPALLPNPQDLSQFNNSNESTAINPFATSGFRNVIVTSPNQSISDHKSSVKPPHSSNPFLLKTKCISNVSTAPLSSLSISQTVYPKISGGFQSELLSTSTSLGSSLNANTPIMYSADPLNVSSRSTDAGDTPPFCHSISKPTNLDWSDRIDRAISERRFRDCVNIAREASKRTELGTIKNKPFGEKELSDLVYRLGHEFLDYHSAVLTACIETHPSTRVLTMLVDLIENHYSGLAQDQELVKTIYKHFCKVLVAKNSSSKNYFEILEKFIIAFSALGQWEKIWTILIQSNLTRLTPSSFILVTSSLLEQADLSRNAKPSWYKTAVQFAAVFSEEDVEKSAQLAPVIAQLWLRCIEVDLADFLAILGGFPDKPLLPQVKNNLLDELEGLVVQFIMDNEYKKLISLIQAGSELLDDLLEVFVKGFSLLGDDMSTSFEQFVELVSAINFSNYFSLWCGFLKDVGYILLKNQSDRYLWRQVMQIYSCITRGVLLDCPSSKKFIPADAFLLNLEAIIKSKQFEAAFLQVEKWQTYIETVSNQMILNRIALLLKEMLNYFLQSISDVLKAEYLFWLLIKCVTENSIDQENVGIQSYYNSVVLNCAKSAQWNKLAHNLIQKAIGFALPKDLKLVLQAYPLRILIVSSIQNKNTELVDLLNLLDRGQKAFIYEKETVFDDHSSDLCIPSDASVEEINLILYGFAVNLRDRLVEFNKDGVHTQLLNLCKVTIKPKDVGHRDPQFLSYTNILSTNSELLKRIHSALTRPSILKYSLRPIKEHETIKLNEMELYTCIYETFKM